jgi:hypothetical protein
MGATFSFVIPLAGPAAATGAGAAPRDETAALGSPAAQARGQ